MPKWWSSAPASAASRWPSSCGPDARPRAEIIRRLRLRWFHFVPSNPWVALGWRKPEEIKVRPARPARAVQGIGFTPRAPSACIAAENAIELKDGRGSPTTIWCRDRPRARLRRDRRASGRRPTAISICHVDHATEAAERVGALLPRIRGPIVIGAVQGASCFGPAYEFAHDGHHRAAPAQDPPPRADHLRHLRALYRPSRPGRGRRHQGLLESAVRDRDMKWMTNAQASTASPPTRSSDRDQRGGQAEAAAQLPSKLADVHPGLPRRPTA